jgi:hypothetical protein
MGAEPAVKEINEVGGYMGRKLELMVPCSTGSAVTTTTPSAKT